MMGITSDARISPIFRYRDAAGAINWLEGAYGFLTHERHEEPDGSVAHAELRSGTGAIGLSSAGPVVPANPWTSVRYGIYVCLANVDALHEQASAAGAAIVRPLADTSYGAREFSVRDVGGHLWSFGTYGMASQEGGPTLFVDLRYPDLRQALDQLPRAFGFEATREVPGADGSLEHAALRLGRDVVMVTSGTSNSRLWGDDTQCVHVYVADPDAHHARAARAGAVILQTPHDMPNGSRGYYSRDVEGFLWEFSSYRPKSA